MSAESSVSGIQARRRRDARPVALLVLVVAVVAISMLVQQFPGNRAVSQPVSELLAADAGHSETVFEYDWFEVKESRFTAPSTAPAAYANPLEDPAAHARQARRAEAEQRFEQALLMLHAKRFDEAAVALQRLVELAPASPDAWVNLGYAFIGLGEFDIANRMFEKAIELNPEQANAYYGMAIGFEGQGDLEAALGGMRSFLHLSQDLKPSQIHVARARSAIWEWESQLGRGPWGPTRGIPPGFTEEELARDGKGVSIKIPLPETADENGVMQYVIKDQDKFEMFDP